MARRGEARREDGNKRRCRNAQEDDDNMNYSAGEEDETAGMDD
jgi:hypothetical protein